MGFYRTRQVRNQDFVIDFISLVTSTTPPSSRQTDRPRGTLRHHALHQVPCLARHQAAPPVVNYRRRNRTWS